MIAEGRKAEENLKDVNAWLMNCGYHGAPSVNNVPDLQAHQSIQPLPIKKDQRGAKIPQTVD